jgi:hypothetical protein
VDRTKFLDINSSVFVKWTQHWNWTATQLLDNSSMLAQKLKFWTATQLLDNSSMLAQKLKFWTAHQNA